MRPILSRAAFCLGLCLLGLPSCQRPPERSTPPGIIITHSPVSTHRYIGSPSLAVMPDGEYIASHDFFGPNSNEDKSGLTEIFASRDHGATWEPRATIDGAFWSKLFVHRGQLYLQGVEKAGGDIVIRRSDDAGRTWTSPVDENSGRLFHGKYGCAPTPFIEHGGRLWRAMGSKMLSAPSEADLLKASSWTLSKPCPPPRQLGEAFREWGEGNAVITPDGRVADLMKIRYFEPGDDRAGLITVSPDGKSATADPATCLVKMPGGRLKFTVRFDPVSKQYWALTNYLMPQDYGPRTDLRRNTVALVSSPDLQNWTLRSVLLHDPDVSYHGLQYLDWEIEGQDLIALCRTAWPDGEGGPNRQHDANYLTFHRFKGFRDLR